MILWLPAARLGPPELLMSQRLYFQRLYFQAGLIVQSLKVQSLGPCQGAFWGRGTAACTADQQRARQTSRVHGRPGGYLKVPSQLFKGAQIPSSVRGDDETRRGAAAACLVLSPRNAALPTQIPTTPRPDTLKVPSQLRATQIPSSVRAPAGARNAAQQLAQIVRKMPTATI